MQDVFYGLMLDQLAPDVTVTAGALETRLVGDTTYGDRPEDRFQRSSTKDSVDLMVGSGASVVLIEPIPRAPLGFDPLKCMGRHQHLEACRFQVPAEPHWYELDLRALAENQQHVAVLNLDHTVCPALPICDPMLGDLVVFRDGAHVTHTFALTFEDEITEALFATQRLQR